VTIARRLVYAGALKLGFTMRRSHVDVVGFVFALAALGAASVAQAQIAALRKEVEALKAAQQNK
jgi:hypothetical protein